MNKNQKLAHFIWTGIDGTSLTKEEKVFLEETPPAGVILFTRNYESPEQLFKLTQSLQKIALQNGSKTPFFIGVDMEGGRVQRLKEPFTLWPPMKKVADKGSTSLAFDFAKSMAQELRAVGINFNFSPCTDVLLNTENEVIGNRAFSDDVNTVGKFASSVTRGFIKENILTCAKHFPGHGYSFADSHEILPIDERSLDEIVEIDAFKKVLRSKVPFIMPGHLLFPKIDSQPVTLSQKWIQDILLNEMNCRALLISDDLEMGALKEFNFAEMVERVYNLGFHQLLFCHSHTKAKKALSVLSDRCDVDERRLAQILELKNKSNLLGPKTFDSSIIGHAEHKKIAAELTS